MSNYCSECGIELVCPKCTQMAKGIFCENCNNLIKHASQYDVCPVCGSSLKVNY